MTNISHRKMGPRGPPRIEEQLKMMKSRFESVLDPDDPFLQHGLGLLLIAKSANDSLFHKLVASIKSPEEGTRDQARRTLSRWAKSNQRVDQTTSYSSLVEKAENLPPDKREIVLNHFKAIPTCDDGEPERCSEHGGKGREYGIFRNPNEALRAARRVSRSLLERLETPTTKLEGPGPSEDTAPAEGAVPGKGVEQSEQECPEGEIEKDSNPSDQANGGKENDEEQEQEGPAENDENGTTQVAQTSMSPLPTAPHLASAASGHSIGSASPPDPPAPAEPINRRSNAARRQQTRFFQADGESGTCPTSTKPETRIAFEGANLKERRGKAQGKGCDRVGVNSSHQRQNEASEQGGMEKTPGAQTSQQSGSEAMLTAQLEQVASTIAELTELQKITDQKLAASLEGIEGVMQQKIVPSLQRIEDAVNRYLEQQSQRTGPDSGQRAAMGTLPVAEVIGVAVGASHQFETVGRSTANGRTRRQRGVEAGQAQRRIQRTGTNSGRRAAGSVSGANVPGGAAAADTLPVAEEVDLIVGTSDQVETGGRSAARESQGEVGEVQHEIYIPNGEPSSNLAHERIFAVYFGGL